MSTVEIVFLKDYQVKDSEGRKYKKGKKYSLNPGSATHFTRRGLAEKVKSDAEIKAEKEAEKANKTADKAAEKLEDAYQELENQEFFAQIDSPPPSIETCTLSPVGG